MDSDYKSYGKEEQKGEAFPRSQSSLTTASRNVRNDSTQERTPLPLVPLSAIGFAMFVNSLIMPVLFPFAPLMVSYFQLAATPADIGYYTGVLATSVYLGSMISGPFWGYVSDVIGQKPVVFLGLLGNATFCLIFGLSPNYEVAVLCRFALGLFSSIPVVSKTLISDLCDDSNMSDGFSIFGLSWGLGQLLGPIIGGFLVEPAILYPGLFTIDGFFGQEPFFLPNLVMAILNIIAIPVSLIYLPTGSSTLRRSLSKQSIELGPAVRKSKSFDVGSGVFHGDTLAVSKGSADAKKDKLNPLDRIKFHSSSLSPSLFNVEKLRKSESQSTIVDLNEPGLWRTFFGNKDTLLSFFLLCLTGFAFTAFDEVFPLWALTSWSLGGLGFTSEEAGLAEAPAGLIVIPVALFLFPWMMRKLGVKAAVQWSLVVGIFQATAPLLRMFGYGSLTLQLMSMLIVLIRSFNQTGMSGMFVLYNNSIQHPQYMGILNGIQATGLGFCQAFAPWIVDSLFAWSLNINSFPFDFHLVWYFIGFLYVLGLVLASFLGDNLNTKKEADDIDTKLYFRESPREVHDIPQADEIPGSPHETPWARNLAHQVSNEIPRTSRGNIVEADKGNFWTRMFPARTSDSKSPAQIQATISGRSQTMEDVTGCDNKLDVRSTSDAMVTSPSHSGSTSYVKGSNEFCEPPPSPVGIRILTSGVQETQTPLPMVPLFAIGFAMFVNSLIMPVLFPFAPLMVAYFHVAATPADVGYYAGILATSVYFGSMISGPIWGYISDHIGQKPVVILGLLGNIVFCLIFGLSSNFPMALLCRFALGLVSSIPVVTKTLVSDLCDDTNLSTGFSIFGLAWGLGQIFGPIIGGFLVDPSKLYPSLFSADGFFGKEPFFLPNLFMAVLNFIAIPICLMYLPGGVRVKSGIVRAMSTVDVEIGKPSKSSSPLQAGSPSVRGENVENKVNEANDPGLWGAFFANKDILLSFSLLCITGFMFTAFDELFPLWALTDWSLGGLGFSSWNVGLSEAPAGLIVIPIALLFFPWMMRKLGVKAAVQWTLVAGMLQATTPLLRMLGYGSVTLQIVSMLVVAIRSFNETGISGMFVLYNNSIQHPQYMGILNGIQATGLGFSQACAPWVIGSLFAWSLNINSFPLDFHLAWFTIGFLYVLALVLSTFLGEELDKRSAHVAHVHGKPEVPIVV